MVDILLLQTVSIAIASAGILIASIYYVLQIRHQNKARQMSVLMNLYSTWGSDDMRKAAQDSFGLEDKYKDYDNFVKEYGFDSQAWVDVNKMLWFVNGIGFLVYEGFVDLKLVLDLFQTQGAMRAWEKWKPFVEGQRKAFGLPESYAWIEYLYNEVKKREQRGVGHG
jgi:hypothetical protein